MRMHPNKPCVRSCSGAIRVVRVVSVEIKSDLGVVESCTDACGWAPLEAQRQEHYRLLCSRASGDWLVFPAPVFLVPLYHSLRAHRPPCIHLLRTVATGMGPEGSIISQGKWETLGSLTAGLSCSSPEPPGLVSLPDQSRDLDLGWFL